MIGNDETEQGKPVPSSVDAGGSVSCEAPAAPEIAAVMPPVRNRLIREVLDWGRSIIIAVALALVIKATVVQAYMIPTPSMVPTIIPEDRLFGNKFVYYYSSPQRGDIIAFKPPVVDDRIPYLKRVMGIEGDEIMVRKGKVYRNGKALNETYIREPMNPFDDYGPIKVKPGFLFVMGDNRNNSSDSRRFGLVPINNVQAKAFFRFWPPSRIGIVR